MKRIDAHQHLWELQRFPYTWCGGIPALNRSFLLDDYLAAIEGTGIEQTVFVECDVDEPHALSEAQHVQDLADRSPIIAGIVASARPERADFPAQLEALLNLPKLRGIRRVLHVVPDDVSRSTLFAENVRRLTAHNLTFDLCVLARQLSLAVALAGKCPDVQFILDHCGVPDVRSGVLDPWRANISELARLPNVACKISGLVVYAGEHWTTADLRPWVEHVVASFGWDRLVWGGDWPVCTITATLGQWSNASNELFAAAALAEREKVFYKNAQRIYRV